MEDVLLHLANAALILSGQVDILFNLFLLFFVHIVVVLILPSD